MDHHDDDYACSEFEEFTQNWLGICSQLARQNGTDQPCAELSKHPIKEGPLRYALDLAMENRPTPENGETGRKKQVPTARDGLSARFPFYTPLPDSQLQEQCQPCCNALFHKGCAVKMSAHISQIEPSEP